MPLLIPQTTDNMKQNTDAAEETTGLELHLFSEPPICERSETSSVPGSIGI